MVRLLVVICLVGLGIAPAAAQSSRANDAASLAARLQQFEDKEEIQNLLLDYGRHLDNRDFAAYSRLFAKDGEWVGGFGSVKGPANIKAFMEKNMGTGPNPTNNYHLMSNFVIKVTGDTATAWSRWAFVAAARAWRRDRAGRTLRRHVRARERRWKFKKRTASNDTAAPPRLRHGEDNHESIPRGVPRLRGLWSSSPLPGSRLSASTMPRCARPGRPATTGSPTGSTRPRRASAR